MIENVDRYRDATSPPGGKLFNEKFNFAPYWRTIIERVNRDILKGTRVLPDLPLWFEGINRVPLDKFKVLILGQDPYPNPADACGIAFASKSGERTASLATIEKELKRTYGEDINLDYSLSSWVSQGVMLLNTALTIPFPSSEKQNHREIGWGEFVKDILDAVFSNFNIVLLTFGSFARNLYIEYNKTHSEHVPIEWISTTHPSPRANASAKFPFIGSNVFKRCNQILIANKLLPIRWFL